MLTSKLFLILSFHLFGAIAVNNANRIMLKMPRLRFEGGVEKSTVQTHNKTVVCVLNSWAHWRQGEGKFQFTDIDPTLCTQLVYRTAEINDTTFEIEIKDVKLAERLGWFRKVTSLSKTTPTLKVLLSVGGWEEGSWSFSEIAGNGEHRRMFVNSVVLLLKKHGFDGIDIAWEYPANVPRGGRVQDKDHLPVLLKDLKEALKPKYLLTMTVSGKEYYAAPAYKVGVVSKLVDQLNIKSFDYAGPWDKQAYHHAAVSDMEGKASLNHIISYYLREASPDKLVIGIPFHGRTFLLENDPPSADKDPYAASGLQQPSKGTFKTNWVEDRELAAYNEICYNMTQQPTSWLKYVDNFCLVPFARRGRQWISFDDLDSVETKVQLMIDQGLKGVMAWTIDKDDFKGTACKEDGDNEEDLVKYPLLRTINHYLTVDAESSQPDADPGKERTNEGPVPFSTEPRQLHESIHNYTTTDSAISVLVGKLSILLLFIIHFVLS